MNLLRSILAVLFAIVIANPVCCCAVEPEPGASTGCCAGGGAKNEHMPHDEPCVCAGHIVKQAEDPSALPSFTPVELPPLAESLSLPVANLPSGECRGPQPGVHNDTGPPRLRLILFQRLLI